MTALLNLDWSHFQVLSRHMVLLATVLDSAALEFLTKAMGSQERAEQWKEATCISPLWSLSAPECTKWAKECMTALYILLDYVSSGSACRKAAG